MRKRRGQPSTNPQCPDGHGDLLPSNLTPGQWFCIHAEHNGRPSTHPLGEAKPTKYRFTDEELKEITNG